VIKTIILATDEHVALNNRLSELLRLSPKPVSAWQELREELSRAHLVLPQLVPIDVVRLGSTFSVRDLANDELDTFTLVWPEQADVERARISVLAPLGTAVLGYAAGDEITWDMPGGTRRLRLETVTPPASAA
jgi:regulator of nucleoside diphosphate kinase